MRHVTRLVLAATASAIVPLTTGCLATQSQLKHASDMQSAQLAQTRSDLASERAQRAASDSALAQQLGMVQGDVQQLRADLDNMKKDFGAKITAMEDGLHFAMPVNFAYDDAGIRQEDQAQLDRFSKVAQKYYPGSKITIEGFADPAGTVRYNQQLSLRRANAVKSYLVAAGLTTNDLATIGYGKTRLVVPGASHDMPGAEANRRVTFVIESRGEKSVAMAPDGQ
jgi:outer membrane protein OmpA-like peptidoglycan-associated protein